MKKILLLLALLSVSNIAFAQSEGQTIDIGIYVLNVGKFDVSSGSYTVDFYLSMKCTNLEVECNPTFEFMNGRASSIDKLIDDEHEKFYRVQAALSQNIDLKSYPFDKHKLSIEIEDKLLTKEDLEFVVDESESGIDEYVTIIGWGLKDEPWSAEVVDHYYPQYDETFSRFVFNINIERIALSSVMKLFLPVFFMVFVGMLAFLLGMDKISQRLTVNTSTLLAAVFFHINSTSSIPPVGYLTFADKFMVTTYVILIISLFSTLFILRYSELKDEAKAKKINKLSMILVPVIAIVLYSLVFLIG